MSGGVSILSERERKETRSALAGVQALSGNGIRRQGEVKEDGKEM